MLVHPEGRDELPLLLVADLISLQRFASRNSIVGSTMVFPPPRHLRTGHAPFGGTISCDIATHHAGYDRYAFIKKGTRRFS